MKKIKYRLVHNRRKKLDSQGRALIQVEASIGKQKTYFSTQIYVRPDEWDKKKSQVIKHPHAKDFNTWIFEYLLKLEEQELSLWKRGITPTLHQIKDATKHESTSKLSFESFCTSIIERSTRKKSTQYNLYGTLSLMNKFSPTYHWDDLNYSFLRDFEYWLLRKGYAVNTVAKHLRDLRTLINEAIAAGYITPDANPFRQFTIKHEKTPHRFLKPEELAILEKAPIDGSLDHIRDAFLFCCYTGLRFSDFKQLDELNFHELKGRVWLTIKTEKTGSHVQIPLDLIFGGKALKILRQYPSVKSFTDIGNNCNVNRYLAELQQQCGITTKITFHTARHTCATLLCHQGVPITTVQKILGHSNLSTTQIYSEIMTETIVRDLSNVR